MEIKWTSIVLSCLNLLLGMALLWWYRGSAWSQKKNFPRPNLFFLATSKLLRLSILFIVGISTLELITLGITKTIYHPTNSYIREIKVKDYNSADLINILDNFNEMGDNVLVRYSGYRPIDIMEVEKLKDGNGNQVLGLALYNEYHCKISIDSKLNSQHLKAVVLHEYLHCMGFEHVRILGDLMAPSADRLPTEKNIEWYAQELKRKLYGNSR